MKKHILVGMCILLCGILFAEENLGVTTDDTPVWDEYPLYVHTITKTFPKDTKVVISRNRTSKSTIIDRDGCIEKARDAYTSSITVDDGYYTVEAKNIVPIDTPDLFDESFLTIAHYPSRYLIASYFADVLKSGTRSTMIKYEKDFIEGNIRISSEYDDPWWEYSGLTDESIITQSVIHINRLGYFFIKQIEKIPDGYKVDVIKNTFSDRREYPLFFQFDGDYVDVYEDNLSNKVLSLTYVSPDFYEGVKSVIANDAPVDLSNLIWPRRANGSSDYDDDIIPRQELPQIYRDPLQDTSIAVDETTTLEEVKEAIEKSSSLNFLNNEDRYGRTSLETAIVNNPNLEIIKFLIESGAKVSDSTLFYTASFSDDIELYKLLIELGADIDRLNPLEVVIEENRSLDIIKLLIESGANVNGQTLISAVNSDNIEFCKLLIEAGAGAYINEKDSKDETPMGLALNKDPEIISILLNAGASLEIVDNRLMSETEGMSIFEVSQEYEYFSSSKILAELEKMGWKENSDDKIIWQQRGKIYDTTDNLRLRATEGVSGNPLFTLAKDTSVKILSIGKIEKIDEIIAYWVEVEVAEDTIDTQGEEVKKGAVGWCFGGYLTNENIVYEVSPRTVTEVSSVAVAEVSIEKATEVEEVLPEFESTEQANPITVWVLLGGGVLLLGAVVVVVIVIRKKKK